MADDRREKEVPRWIIWMLMVTSSLLLMNIVAVYLIARRDGQWPMSHPWSGITQGVMAIWLRGQAWTLKRFGVLSTRVRTQSAVLVAACVVVLVGAVYWLIANLQMIHRSEG